MITWANISAYQFLILAVGGGVGGSICLFGMKAFVSSIIRPKLYDKDGQPIYVSKADCDKQTDDYRNVIRAEFEGVKAHQDKIIEFQNILKGYYIKKGVKFP